MILSGRGELPGFPAVLEAKPLNSTPSTASVACALPSPSRQPKLCHFALRSTLTIASCRSTDSLDLLLVLLLSL